jgi:hypothetical protein
MNVFQFLTITGITSAALLPNLFSEGEEFIPIDPSSEQDAFYAKPLRHVDVDLTASKTGARISKAFLGMNLSYFNTTDQIWNDYALREKLSQAKVGALRYPGGEETSYFHWQHPGVNGYEDVWDDPKTHGFSHGRGRFQTTWVAPEQWDCNEDYMDFDEFMAECLAIGAEPIVGLNLSSGRKHNRQAEGLQEALEWMRYAKAQGYEVKYWFLDNEPWHFEANHTFTLEEYAEEVVAYGTAIKKEFPDVKLITNPAGASGLYANQIEKFARLTGEVIDHIDVHWYWAWGISSFDYWLEHTPLNNNDKWKKRGQVRTFAQDIQLIRDACRRAGYPHIGVVALEWNMAPSKASQTFNQSLIATIQAELLMEFAKYGVELTCLWPLIWQTERDVWSEQDLFPSIVTTEPPFNPTLSLDMFRMLSAAPGKAILESTSSRGDVVVLAAEDSDESVFYLINKSALRRKISVNEGINTVGEPSGETIALKSQVVRDVAVDREGEGFAFFAEPYSFTAIRFSR